ncbi:MAG TPA: alkaline phosphatase family protein [Capillimicrobium sp.]|jgi:phospholipase C
MPSDLTRRKLIAGGAALGAAAAGAAVWRPWSGGGGGSATTAATAPSKTVRAADVMTAGPAKITDIEHVVIVFQENRSFDHYFGTFPGVDGFGRASRDVLEQAGFPGAAERLAPWRLRTGGGPQCIPDPNHDWAPQHAYFNDGKMDRWVLEHMAVDGPKIAPMTMGYFDHEDLEFLWKVAEEFTICDRYFCSVLGPSDPNHLYMMSATLDPGGKAGGPFIITPPAGQLPIGKFTWTTYPEQLQAKGVDWKVYAAADRDKLENLLACFKQFHRGDDLSKRGLDNVYPNDFLADVRRGELPQVSWVLGPIDESEHPMYSSPKSGVLTSRTVLDELMSRPDLWEKTVVIITYDENGGFFDHVAPPIPERDTKDEYLSVDPLPVAANGVRGPIGLGFRVPSLIASPFTKGGFVSSDTFDHTSVLLFLEKRFGAEVPNLSAWRRDTVGDLTSAMNFAQPDASRIELPPARVSRDQLHACQPPRAEQPPRDGRLPTQAKGTPKRPSGLVA